MIGFLKKGVLGIALGASALTIAAPAQAQRYDRYRGDRGDDAAIAIGAGVLGLAVGAAIASDRRDGYYDDRRYYDRGYYAGPRYQGYYYSPRYRAYPQRYYRDRPYRDRYYSDRKYGGYKGSYKGGYRYRGY